MNTLTLLEADYQLHSVDNLPFVPRVDGYKSLAVDLSAPVSGQETPVIGEAAFRQELLLACVLVPLAFFLHVSRIERAVMVACVLLVLIVELLNAAIEAVVDKASPEWHELAKKAKDMASGAVLLALINVLVVWLLILIG